MFAIVRQDTDARGIHSDIRILPTLFTDKAAALRWIEETILPQVAPLADRTILEWTPASFVFDYFLGLRAWTIVPSDSLPVN